MQSLRRNAQTLAAEFIFARLAWARLVHLFTWRNILSRLRCRFQSRAWSHPVQRTRANWPSYYMSTINYCDFKRCLRPRGEAGIQWLLPRLTHATFLVVCHGERRKCTTLSEGCYTEGEAWRMLAHWPEEFLTLTKDEGWLTCARARSHAWFSLDIKSHSSNPVVPNPGPGGPQHCTFCMSPESNTPDSGHQLIRRNSKTWNWCHTLKNKGA